MNRRDFFKKVIVVAAGGSVAVGGSVAAKGKELKKRLAVQMFTSKDIIMDSLCISYWPICDGGDVYATFFFNRGFCLLGCGDIILIDSPPLFSANELWRVIELPRSPEFLVHVTARRIEKNAKSVKA